jgi:hypothetical protein
VKGAVANCLQDMVVERFGADAWERTLKTAGLPPDERFPISRDVPDGDVVALIGAACEAIPASFDDAADAFGQYWVCVYMPKLYKSYFRGIVDAKDFLVKLNSIHRRVTTAVAGAQPPKFEYRWIDDDTLQMTYLSERGLQRIFIGMVRGVGEHFRTPLDVRALDDRVVEIRFPRGVATASSAQRRSLADQRS